MSAAAPSLRAPAARLRLTAAPALSLHSRIVAEIETPILAGDWPPGTRIATEQEIAARHGCSRMTVSKALGQLAAAGLIERRRKAGSFVRRPPSQSAVLEIRDIRSEVEALGLAYRFEVLSRRLRAGRPGERERLDAGGAPLVEITCLHFSGGEPFCLEERLISTAAVPEAASEAFTELAPGAWLVARVPWTGAEHRIRAAAAGRAGARLNIPAAAPCLVVERRTWRGAQPLTHVRLTYPGASHTLAASFTPQSG